MTCLYYLGQLKWQFTQPYDSIVITFLAGAADISVIFDTDFGRRHNDTRFKFSMYDIAEYFRILAISEYCNFSG